METNSILKSCGSITKFESLHPITSNIMENTWVEEANLPYADYYGQVPDKPIPNSLFLFTSYYYSLEELFYFSRKLDLCFNEKLNIASAIFQHNKIQYPAIRIKLFPDYKQIHTLQECFAKQGVVFAQQRFFISEAKTVINKFFELEKIDDDIYLDMIEENKGYIFIKDGYNRNSFEETILNIKHNANCVHFDAVSGGLILNSRSYDFIRIYSKRLDLELLSCIKKQFEKLTYSAKLNKTV